VACWGSNRLGQLGSATTLATSTPVDVEGVADATQIDAYGDDTCALKVDGTIVCWGAEGPPRPVPDVSSAAQVSRHFFGMCALMRAGSVHCWTSAVRPDPEKQSPSTALPWERDADVPGVTDAVEVRDSCVLRRSGAVSCWGRSSPSGYAGVPEPVGIDDAVAIASGSGYGCALRRAGQVTCWGRDTDAGELGDGGAVTGRGFRTHEPRGCEATVAITGSFWNTCEVCGDGKGVCWGGRAYGKLQNLRGKPPGMEVGGAIPTGPEPVEQLDHATEIAAGPFHACARETTGKVVCWGENGDGQLGGGFSPRQGDFTPVEGVTDAVRVDSTGEYACALRRGGAVSCWGKNRDGQLGDGTWASRGEAAPVHELDGATSISVAQNHACATRLDGRVVCWGSDIPAARRDNDDLAFDSLTPAVGAKLDDAVEVSATRMFTCARTRSGQVGCWGDYWGLSANGDTGVPGDIAYVPGLGDAREISTGELGACIVRRSGRLLCFGAGSITPWAPGPAGMEYPSHALTRPRELRGFVDVASVRVPGCLVQKSGRVHCWDPNGPYLLPEKALPRTSVVVDLTDAVSVGPGGIVVRATGQLAAIRQGDGGRWLAKPFAPEIHDAVDASNTCAVRKNGTVVCWGDDDYGQLGGGKTGRSQVVVPVLGFP
jgi:alpha-tubulin suppressor-like RCC1 family protein